MPEFEDDCMNTLEYIFNIQNSNNQTINWADTINHLGMEKKGFAYIEREGISVFSAKQLQAEDKVSIHFSDGTVHATVQ